MCLLCFARQSLVVVVVVWVPQPETWNTHSALCKKINSNDLHTSHLTNFTLALRIFIPAEVQCSVKSLDDESDECGKGLVLCLEQLKTYLDGLMR